MAVDKIQIRANKALSNIVIIGVTSNTNEQVHQRAKTAGMNDVAVKPLLKKQARANFGNVY